METIVLKKDAHSEYGSIPKGVHTGKYKRVHNGVAFYFDAFPLCVYADVGSSLYWKILIGII